MLRHYSFSDYSNILAPIRERKKLIEQQARLQRREKKNASEA